MKRMTYEELKEELNSRRYTHSFTTMRIDANFVTSFELIETMIIGHHNGFSDVVINQKKDEPWVQLQFDRFEFYRDLALNPDVMPLLNAQQRDWTTSCHVNWTNKRRRMTPQAERSFERNLAEVMRISEHVRKVKDEAKKEAQS